MPDGFSYAILGRGAWALKVQSVLENEQRRVTCIAHTRREARESDEGYISRVGSALRASGAEVAWLCVPAGPHVARMMEAAMAAGLHAIAEKPWLCSSAETEWLAASAAQRSIRLGVHFQYCLLDEVEAWRERYLHTAGLRFGGRFAISRAGRHSIPAMVNLGSHLLAIRRYAVPQSEITELVCAYAAADERRVWIQGESIDFLENRQPIIQRFLTRFEAAIQGAELPFGIEFGLRVAEDLLRWLALQKMEFLQP